MTKKNGKYARMSIHMTFKDKDDIKEAAYRCEKTMSKYILDLHYNNNGYQDTKKDPA